MSETFFIKHTAFDDFSNNINDRENTSFVIGPGELNGPGGRDPRASDLELYGFGALKWGEGVNQNLFRILENFACPQKTTGSPPVDVLPIQPISEAELGLGNGITVPVIGQTWFNTTDKELYMYGPAGWSQVTATASSGGSAALDAHIINDLVHLIPVQNDFLDGLTLPTLTSTNVNQLIGFTDSLGTVQQQLDLMVEKAGDAMTGNLELNNNSELLFNSGINRITGVGPGELSLRIGSEYNVGHRYTSTEGAAWITLSAGGSQQPNASIALGDQMIGTPGGLINATAFFEFTNDGNVSASAPTPTNNDHLTRKDYVDSVANNTSQGTIPVGGIIMYNGTLAAIPANWQLCTGANGTPNMTNKFVYGTNVESQIKTTGGYANSINVSHNHSATQGSHYHKMFTTGNTSWRALQNGFSNYTVATGGTGNGGPDDIYQMGGSTSTNPTSSTLGKSAYASNNSVTVNYSGSSGTNRNIPPYVKLAYIQRMS